MIYTRIVPLGHGRPRPISRMVQRVGFEPA